MLYHVELQPQGIRHDVLLVLLNDCQVLSHSLHVGDIIPCVSEGKTCIHKCEHEVHCHEDRLKLEWKEVSWIYEIDCAHNHSQICRLIPVKLLYDNLPTFTEKVEESEEDCVANSDHRDASHLNVLEGIRTHGEPWTEAEVSSLENYFQSFKSREYDETFLKAKPCLSGLLIQIASETKRN